MNLEDFKVMKDRYNTIVAEYKKNVADFGEDLFSQTTKNVFEKNSNLKSFSWTQYTPYFNDGSICEFDVDYEYDMYINDEYIKVYDLDSWLESDYLNAPMFKYYGFATMQELVSAVKDLHNVLDLFSKDDLEIMFGDHARIIVYSDGVISVEEHIHD